MATEMDDEGINDEIIDDEVINDEIIDDEGINDSAPPADEVKPPKENSTIAQMRAAMLEQKQQLQRFENQEAERQRQAIQQQLSQELPPKPTFESCGFDPVKLETELEKWSVDKVKHDTLIQQQVTEQTRRQQDADRLWSSAQNRYVEGRKNTAIKDYATLEATVETELSKEQLSWLLVSTEKPNNIVAIVGRDEKLLSSLKKAQTPFAFAAMIGRIEATKGGIMPRKPVTPENRPKSTASGPGAVTGRSKAYDAAVAEAQRTGNLDALRALKNKAKK